MSTISGAYEKLNDERFMKCGSGGGDTNSVGCGCGIVAPPRTRLKRPRSAFGPFLQSMNPYSSSSPIMPPTDSSTPVPSVYTPLLSSTNLPGGSSSSSSSSSIGSSGHHHVCHSSSGVGLGSTGKKSTAVMLLKKGTHSHHHHLQHHPQLFTRIMAAQNQIVFEGGKPSFPNRCCSSAMPHATTGVSSGRQLACGPAKNSCSTANLLLNSFSSRSRANIFLRQRFSSTHFSPLHPLLTPDHRLDLFILLSHFFF